MPSVAKMATAVGDGNLSFPTHVYLVGGRKIYQQTFLNLIPVGEDTDGSIKRINELSYAPTGVGGETYVHEIWGKELLACYSNIADITQRELAEKCIFKWYAIDYTLYDKTKVLPLLNIIADTVTEEGTEEHDKPYVMGKKTIWDGTTFKTLSKARLSEGWSIDKKLGIVKFSQPVTRTYNDTETSAAIGFIGAELDLIAAYERKEGDYDDFIFWYRNVSGGTERPSVHKEGSLLGYYLDTGTPPVVAWTLQNKIALDDYADKALASLEPL